MGSTRPAGRPAGKEGAGLAAADENQEEGLGEQL